MCQLDERVLECLADEEWGTPRSMARAFRFTVSPARVRERCERLRAAGFVAPLLDGGRRYELTVWGRRYLDGDLDASYHAPGRQ